MFCTQNKVPVELESPMGKIYATESIISAVPESVGPALRYLDGEKTRRDSKEIGRDRLTGGESRETARVG